MKRLPIPTSEMEWRRTAFAITGANLELAHMSNIDLATALAELGIHETTPKAISAKLARGSFIASFLLQCLAAMGTGQIELPSAT